MMRKFLTRVSIFTIVILVILAGNYAINSFLINTNPPKLKAKILIAGDSHMMYSLDPRLLKNSVNVSQEAEPYVATFLKLRALTKNNRFDTVLVGFSYHNISDYNDEKFANAQWSAEMFRRLYSIVSLHDFNGIAIDKQNYYREVAKNMLVYPKLTHHEYIGKFKAKKGSKVSDQAINTDNFFNSVSAISIQYLDSIVHLSQRQNFRLVLVNTPLRPDFMKKIPANFIKSFDELGSKLSNQGVHILDYAQFDIPETHFYNESHLNGQGASQFTETVAKKLREGTQ